MRDHILAIFVIHPSPSSSWSFFDNPLIHRRDVAFEEEFCRNRRCKRRRISGRWMIGL